MLVQHGLGAQVVDEEQGTGDHLAQRRLTCLVEVEGPHAAEHLEGGEAQGGGPCWTRLAMASSRNFAQPGVAGRSRKGWNRRGTWAYRCTGPARSVRWRWASRGKMEGSKASALWGSRPGCPTGPGPARLRSRGRRARSADVSCSPGTCHRRSECPGNPGQPQAGQAPGDGGQVFQLSSFSCPAMVGRWIRQISRPAGESDRRCALQLGDRGIPPAARRCAALPAARPAAA